MAYDKSPVNTVVRQPTIKLGAGTDSEGVTKREKEESSNKKDTAEEDVDEDRRPAKGAVRPV